MNRFSPFLFLMASLATWRLSALLVREAGPFSLVARVRHVVTDRMNVRVLDCFYCTSLWAAAPMAYWLAGIGWHWPIVWLATSGAAGIFERLTARSPEPSLELDAAAALLAQGRE
jgi:hypothetical protein